VLYRRQPADPTIILQESQGGFGDIALADSVYAEERGRGSARVGIPRREASWLPRWSRERECGGSPG
jgi:hypothetical protein